MFFRVHKVCPIYKQAVKWSLNKISFLRSWQNRWCEGKRSILCIVSIHVSVQDFSCTSQFRMCMVLLVCFSLNLLDSVELNPVVWNESWATWNQDTFVWLSCSLRLRLIASMWGILIPYPSWWCTLPMICLVNFFVSYDMAFSRRRKNDNAEWR